MQKCKFALITCLLFYFIGCATQQKTIHTFTPKKDEWSSNDKAKHFLVSFFIGTLAYSLARAGETDKDDATIIGLSFTTACGIGKEVNDEIKRKDWSYKDLVWDIAGAASALSIANLLD